MGAPAAAGEKEDPVEVEVLPGADIGKQVQVRGRSRSPPPRGDGADGRGAVGMGIQGRRRKQQGENYGRARAAGGH